MTLFQALASTHHNHFCHDQIYVGQFCYPWCNKYDSMSNAMSEAEKEWMDAISTSEYYQIKYVDSPIRLYKRYY